ncbi:MAG: PIG-L family deacetylase [Ginsengibacter sp.]
MRTRFLFSFIFIFQTVVAQQQETYTSSEIFQQIKKLNVLGSVLYIGAHPDDENNSLLPYFAKEKLYRTAYLSLTRGDGGQNLIGDEQGIELGLIRTQELLAARRVDGAEQYFTRAYEFGFSKSAEEALRIWDKDKILSDVVWVIRNYQPDVIIKRFPPDKRAGHGHHAASAILADEAFTAAADPNRFPEQFKYGVKPWQAKRILWNTYNFGGNNTTSEDQLKIDIGGYNSLIGKSYGELGGEARTMHKSQGEGRPERKGQSFEYFATTGGAPLQKNLMDGVITNWNRMEDGKPIGVLIGEITATYKLESPELSVPKLVRLYSALKSLPESSWKNQKLKEAQQIIEAASGLFVEATSSQPEVVQGENLKVDFFINKRNDVDAELKRISIQNFDSSFMFKLNTNQNFSFDKVLPVADDKKISQPYWLEYPLHGGNFEVKDQAVIGNAWNDPSFEIKTTISIDGEDFTILRPVQYRYIDAVKGDTYQPIPVLPKIEVRYNRDNYISMNNQPVTVMVNEKSNDANLSANNELIQHFSGKWKMENDLLHRIALTSNQKNKSFNFVPQSGNANTSEQVEASVKYGDEIYNSYTKTIAYDHIPVITYFPMAKSNLLKLDIKIAGKKVGYMAGAGDKVPEALEQMGYTVTFLHEQDLREDYLKQFDAIITGIRAYNIYDFLTTKNDVLVDYVKNGGNLIVQYLKSNQVGQQKIKAGPYSFSVSSGSRVTEEDAPVTFLLPQHPVLNFPNKISSADFEGWIQERSTYQAQDLDEHFETPLAMHDTGETENKGSLAIAKFGKGNFVYASLVFFRQLPAGIPGAYRLMANLIALAKNN